MLNGSKGTLYRGRWGMWSWVAHRITGIAIFFFLLVHILDTAVVRISPEAYNGVLSLYKNPIMGLGETALVAAIVYHAFNGIRIILIDFWGKATNSHVEHIQAKNKDGNVEISQKATYTHIKILWVVLSSGQLPLRASQRVTCRSFSRTWEVTKLWLLRLSPAPMYPVCVTTASTV